MHDMAESLPTVLATWLAAHGQAVTVAEAARLGIAPAHLQRWERRGHLVRAARSAYVGAAAYTSATPDARHRMRALAIQRTQRQSLVISHVSAAAWWGMPLPEHALGHVHLMRRAARTSKRHRGHTVHDDARGAAVVEHDGAAVLVPALAVIWVAVGLGLTAGVVATDHALHAGLTTLAELDHWLERMRRTPYLSVARSAVALADGRAESPGESRLRLVLVALGHEVVPQWEVRGPDGRSVGRVDFYLPLLGVVVEFDGAVKYVDGRDLAGGPALFNEKRREDDIRLLGYGVARIVWADLAHPERVQAKVDAAARQSRRAAR